MAVPWFRVRGWLAEALRTGVERIDLIDLPSARLAIRAVVAEEGCLLKRDGSLAWSHFLLRTWRKLEEWIVPDSAPASETLTPPDPPASGQSN